MIPEMPRVVRLTWDRSLPYKVSSGAAQRNGECWDLGTYLADPEPFLTFISVRLRLMDDFIDYLEAAPGRIEWLQYTDYENKSRQMNRDWFTLPEGEAEEETP